MRTGFEIGQSINIAGGLNGSSFTGVFFIEPDVHVALTVNGPRMSLEIYKLEIGSSYS